jgi:hypothetical protein
LYENAQQEVQRLHGLLVAEHRPSAVVVWNFWTKKIPERETRDSGNFGFFEIYYYYYYYYYFNIKFFFPKVNIKILISVGEIKFWKNFGTHWERRNSRNFAKFPSGLFSLRWPCRRWVLGRSLRRRMPRRAEGTGAPGDESEYFSAS